MANENASVSVFQVMQAPNNNSGEKVASCEDVTTEILVRLPLKSLHRCKSVCKRWHSLISDNLSFKLIHNLKPADPPSGLFIQTRGTYPKYDFIQFDVKNPVEVPRRFLKNFDQKEIRIHHSCNGLILCSGSPVKGNPQKFYVYNPSINQFTTIPPLKVKFHKNISNLTLAFDPSISPHYKIIYVSWCSKFYDMIEGYRHQIFIYSPQTRTCKPYFIFGLQKDMDFGGGVYWNNAIHWIYWREGLLLYFNFDQKILHQIKLPFTPVREYDDMMFNKKLLFESRNHLLVADQGVEKIHELNRDYSGWSVKYHIRLPCMSIYNSSVVCIVLGEKEDESFLVLKQDDRVLRFNDLETEDLGFDIWDGIEEDTVETLGKVESVQIPCFIYQSLSTASF